MSWQHWFWLQKRRHLRSIYNEQTFGYCQCCGSGMFIPDPGSDFFPSRIRTVSIPDPGSRILIKEFTYFNPKKPKEWFLSSKKYDPGSGLFIPDPRYGCWLSTHPGSRGQKGTKSRIPDSDPQHWLLPQSIDSRSKECFLSSRPDWTPPTTIFISIHNELDPRSCSEVQDLRLFPSTVSVSTKKIHFRFLPLADPSVDVFISRDLDSRYCTSSRRHRTGHSKKTIQCRLFTYRYSFDNKYKKTSCHRLLTTSLYTLYCNTWSNFELALSAEPDFVNVN